MSAEQIGLEAPFEQEQRAAVPAGEAGGDRGGDGGYELDEHGQRVQHGMGQSKSSRRRRRKRKMKSGEPGEAAGGAQDGPDGGDGDAGGGEGPVASIQATGGSPSQSQGGGRMQGHGHANGGQASSGHSAGQAAGNQNGNGSAPGGTKRWKKKFRERERPRPGGGDNAGSHASGANSGGGFGARDGYSGPPNGGFGGGGGGQYRGQDTHQPGNGGGFKRKGGFGGGSNGGTQGRGGGGGARGGFVGPMDHSYRAVNGNFADTPPSTMDPYSGGGRRGGYSGDSQPIDYSQGRAIPIAPDAPTHIYFFIEDLFITAKIQETARKLGVKVAFVKNDKESVAQLTAGEDNDRPSLIVFDLNNANAKPMTLMPKLKAKLKKSVSIIGFLSHLQGDLKAKAMESGCDTVMPRAAFSQNLPNLLRRYGIEDTEEVANYNQ